MENEPAFSEQESSDARAGIRLEAVGQVRSWNESRLGRVNGVSERRMEVEWRERPRRMGSETSEIGPAGAAARHGPHVRT